VQLKELFVTEQ